MNKNRFLFWSPWLSVAALLITIQLLPPSWASDHDDGETELKGRALNITDLYVFREDNQTGLPADSPNLVLIMNTNPRSLPGQQYFFSTQARYEFHLSRVTAANKTQKPKGTNDVLLRFQFGAPQADNTQPFTLTLIRDGNSTLINKTTAGGDLLTTTLEGSKTGKINTNTSTVDNQTLAVFAGLREDPFFFDVEQFFKVRAHALKTSSFLGFLAPSAAKDFTHNYNVNAIVVRIPLRLLQTGANEPVFDVWTTISIPQAAQ